MPIETRRFGQDSYRERERGKKKKSSGFWGFVLCKKQKKKEMGLRAKVGFSFGSF